MQFAIHKESKVRTRRVRVYAFVLAGAVALEAGVGPASAQCQIAQIRAADGAGGDHFGWAVAIGGDGSVECLSDEDCDDGNECTGDVCDTGSCVFPYLPGGTSCGDPTDNDCTAPDTCDGAGVCLDNHVPDETPCTDDGLFCTGEEQCADGVCQSSGDPCTEVGTACDEEGDECAPDCNDNGVPDAQDIAEGTSEDCNANDLPDECETPGTSHATVFGTGLFTPEGITPTQGDYPPGLFVAGYEPGFDGSVYHLPPDGGEATEFAPRGCAALVFVPDEFGGAGTRLFVADAGTDVYEVGSDGSVTEFFNAFGSLLVPSGLAYAPRSVGGPVAGRLLVSGQGNGELHNEDPTLFAIDADGSSQRIAGLPEEPFSITLAPVHFGAFGHRLFIACASSRILYELNLHSLEMTQFMALPSGTYGLLRQITFSPVGWAAPLDEDLADESVMLVSAGQFSSNGRGDVTVWDQRGRFVALMRPGPYGDRVNPRGMAFVGDDLFISSLNDDAVIRATVNDFYVDCNLNEIPDECELPDCNGNGVPDDCEPDCNENGIPDECDIAEGTSLDSDADGVPDECERLFVDAMATGANDGSNWINAFTSLRDALVKATVFGGGVEEIWVAAGTYHPELDEGHHVGRRSASFQLVNRVGLYGGFEGADSVRYPGGETDRDQRDPAANVTILSGDLDANDGPDFTNIDENTLHVVTARCCGRSSVLDGFTITAGNADDISWPLRTDFGAGMYNLGSNLTVANCTFSYNFVIGCGAGMYNDGLSNPTLINCAFRRNYAVSQWTSGIGGGIGSGAGSGPTLTDCIFTENHADHTGGGMSGAGNPTLMNCQFSNNTAGENGGGLACAGAPMLTDCSFTGNVAGTEGGGMDQCDGGATLSGCVFAGNWADIGAGIASEGSSQLSDCTFTDNTASEEGGAMAQWSGSPTLTDCTFAANSAEYGGGMVIRESSPMLTDCTFLGNSATAHGGGIASFDMSNLTLTDCLVQGNQAGGSGGGLVSKESDATLLNCAFDGNLANRTGGGIYSRDGSGVVAHSCTFAGNSALSGPAVVCDSLHLQYPNDLEMTDCILWDGGGEIWNNDGSAITITYSDVQGGWTGTGNMNEDPRFVPGPAGCYYLSQISAGQTLDSPCVDAGGDTAANLGLDTLTTRSDEGVDTGIADMGYHYPITGRPLVMGDFDRDLDVDLADFAEFQSCFTGNEPLDVSPCCRIFDFASDGDIDLDDYAALEPALTGG